MGHYHLRVRMQTRLLMVRIPLIRVSLTFIGDGLGSLGYGVVIFVVGLAACLLSFCFCRV